MNLKPVLIIIVIAAILSVSIVAAYENVESNLNNGSDESVSSQTTIPSHHSIHHSYKTYEDNTPINDFTIDEYLLSLFN